MSELRSSSVASVSLLSSVDVQSWIDTVDPNLRFAPHENIAKQAYVGSMDEYQRLYRQSIEDPELFWSEIAQQFHWHKKWDTVTRSEFDHTKGQVQAEWFVGGQTNISYNCLDVHVQNGRGDDVAFFWEGNEDNQRYSITYRELHDKVCRFANVLKSLGVQKGHTVALYLPMVVELAVAMLACARIGAIHSVVFGGFSSHALAARIADCKAKVLITAGPHAFILCGGVVNC